MGQGCKKLTQDPFVSPPSSGFPGSLLSLHCPMPTCRITLESTSLIGYEMVQDWEILNHELQTGCEK